MFHDKMEDARLDLAEVLLEVRRRRQSLLARSPVPSPFPRLFLCFRLLPHVHTGPPRPWRVRVPVVI